MHVLVIPGAHSLPLFFDVGLQPYVSQPATPCIPGAHSLPLFSDDERAAVGTCYKKL